MILALIDEAGANGAREHAACALFGLSPRAPQRWRAADIGDALPLRAEDPSQEPPHRS